jgi:hypothetical protein
MYPLDTLTNAVQPVTLAGKSYPIRQLRLREWGELTAWLKASKPNPVTLAIRALADAEKDGPVPQPVQDSLFRQAQEEARRWPPKTASYEWLRALDDVDGGKAKFFQHVIGVCGTPLTGDEADEIAAKVHGEELWAFIRHVKDGDTSAPKGSGAAVPPTPMTGDGSITSSDPSTA